MAKFVENYAARIFFKRSNFHIFLKFKKYIKNKILKKKKKKKGSNIRRYYSKNFLLLKKELK